MLPEIIISGAKDSTQGRASFDLAMSLADKGFDLDECLNGELDGSPYYVYWMWEDGQVFEDRTIVVRWHNPDPIAEE